MSDHWGFPLCLSSFILFYLFLPFFFRATPEAFGSSQARGQIGTIAAGLPHSPSNQDPSRVCNLQHSSQKCRILNPLSKVRDRTHIFMDTSWICFPCTITGTPWVPFNDENLYYQTLAQNKLCLQHKSLKMVTTCQRGKSLTLSASQLLYREIREGQLIAKATLRLSCGSISMETAVCYCHPAAQWNHVCAIYGHQSYASIGAPLPPITCRKFLLIINRWTRLYVIIYMEKESEKEWKFPSLTSSVVNESD